MPKPWKVYNVPADGRAMKRKGNRLRCPRQPRPPKPVRSSAIFIEATENRTADILAWRLAQIRGESIPHPDVIPPEPPAPTRGRLDYLRAT